jgi:hypothetical protein
MKEQFLINIDIDSLNGEYSNYGISFDEIRRSIGSYSFEDIFGGVNQKIHIDATYQNGIPMDWCDDVNNK